MTPQDREAIERAAYLLSAVESFIAKNPVSDYVVFYDEAFCDGECLREDCRVAKEELELMLGKGDQHGT